LLDEAFYHYYYTTTTAVTMTDLRVNTRAIKDSYLKHDEPLTLHPTAMWDKAGG
jgi:hypothetical protein